MDSYVYSIIFSIFETQNSNSRVTKKSSNEMTTENGIEHHRVVYGIKDCESPNAHDPLSSPLPFDEQ